MSDTKIASACAAMVRKFAAALGRVDLHKSPRDSVTSSDTYLPFEQKMWVVTQFTGDPEFRPNGFRAFAAFADPIYALADWEKHNINIDWEDAGALGFRLIEVSVKEIGA